MKFRNECFLEGGFIDEKIIRRERLMSGLHSAECAAKGDDADGHDKLIASFGSE